MVFSLEGRRELIELVRVEEVVFQVIGLKGTIIVNGCKPCIVGSKFGISCLFKLFDVFILSENILELG